VKREIKKAMKVTGVAAFVLLCGALAQASDVLEFTDDDFAESVAEHDIILVEFFAPWCGHCKKLAPEYEQAATELKAATPPVPLAKVDCTANSDTCQKFGVSGYPTLKIFRGGEMSSDYGGPRQAAGIVSYMKKQSGPSSRELLSVEDAKAFLGDKDASVVGFFSEEGSDLEKAFMSAASSLREDFRFAHTRAEDVLKEYSHKDEIVIYQPPRLQTKLADTETVYDGASTSKSIIDFVKSNFMGIVGHRNMDNAKHFDAKKPLVVVYFDVNYERNAKGTNYYRNRVIKVAKDFVGTATFAISSWEEFGHEVNEYGLEKGDKPVVGARDAKSMKYVMTAEYSVDNLRQFAQDLTDGKLKPHIKSEPVPEDNSGPVTVVVGENFDEIVNDPEKEVLIEFYAPWCGHCKALAPKYDELAEKLKNTENLVIAKIDATSNDYPSTYQVQGYPSIFWKPKGANAVPEKYEGGREVKDFVDFIKKKSTLDVKVEGGKKKKSKEDL
jgi:protein disulfide isomerase family A protein 3